MNCAFCGNVFLENFHHDFTPYSCASCGITICRRCKTENTNLNCLNCSQAFNFVSNVGLCRFLQSIRPLRRFEEICRNLDDSVTRRFHLLPYESIESPNNQNLTFEFPSVDPSTLRHSSAMESQSNSSEGTNLNQETKISTVIDSSHFGSKNEHLRHLYKNGITNPIKLSDMTGLSVGTIKYKIKHQLGKKIWTTKQLTSTELASLKKIVKENLDKSYSTIVSIFGSMHGGKRLDYNSVYRLKKNL